MRCCGNCFWSFSPEDEDELRSEYHGEDYDMDDNTPRAGDCSIGCIHDENYYCASHSYNEYTDFYQHYLSLNIDKYVSIYLYDLINDSWCDDTSNVDIPPVYPTSIGQCDVTALLIKELLGGKIMKCLGVRGDHYYNEINGTVIDLTRDQYDMGEEPLYDTGVEESPVPDEWLLERYKLFLTNFKKNLNVYYFESITNNKKIQRHKSFFEKLCAYTQLQINEYYIKDNIEYMELDFCGSNKDNIFRYTHNLDTDEYAGEDQLLFTYLELDEIPLEIVKSAFEVARDNDENIRMLKKIRNINSHK